VTNAPQPPAWTAQSVGEIAYGGFWLRVVALIIDSFVLSFAVGILTGAIFAVIFLLGRDSDDAALVIGVILGVIGYLVLLWLYEAFMTSSARGATLGKQAIGARVVRGDGTRLSFGRATGRHFAKSYITPLLPMGIGFMMAGWTKGKRALHDMIADTLVIRTR
jgi:uncharacterized RDD family membrane protein YckC